MISICITLKNRTHCIVADKLLTLFPKCVKTLAAAFPKGTQGELVVSDWASDDIPILSWLPNAVANSSLDLTVVCMPKNSPFSRGQGLNAAAEQAKYDILFFLDADMLITQNVINEAILAVRRGKAYFPICYNRMSPGGNGRWRVNGKGIVAIPRSIWAECRWLEITNWGTEDQIFYNCIEERLPVERKRVPGLFHQWHPETTKWKNNWNAKR